MVETPYVCVHPYNVNTDDEGGWEAYKEGQRLPADADPPRTHPHFWAPENDLDEIARKRRGAWEPVYAAAADGNDIPIETVRFRARKPVRLEVDSELREIRKGEFVEVDDPVLVVAPNGFEKVVVRLQHGKETVTPVEARRGIPAAIATRKMR